jgi:YggT family protein
MSIFANNFLYAIAAILDKVLYAYMWLIIIRALLSWVNPDPYNPIVRFLIKVTEPVLYFVRRKLPVYLGGMDFSPVIVLLAIYFLRIFLVKSLMEMAIRMG